MVLIASSRSNKRRSYKILQVENEGSLRVVNITSEVCRALCKPWNNQLGSYDATEPYQWQDTSELAAYLLDKRIKTTVFML